MTNLLFDIGGTKMRLAVSTDGKTFGEPKIIATPENIPELVAEFKQVADELLGGQRPSTVVGGITLKKMGAIEEIKKLFDCPVYIENDTALVGLGETYAFRPEYSKGEKGIVAYVTVSTGVGGVLIINGEIAKHTTSFEPGHQIIDFNQPAKHLEDYISGAAVRAATGKEPREITDEAFWNNLAKILAVGLHNTILHWTPEVVILGGSMMKTPGIPLAVVQTELQKSLAFLPIQPKLKLATLGDLGGLHGALAFLNQQLSKLSTL